MTEDDPERKITPEELREMFGTVSPEGIPMEAMAIILDGDDSRTIGQARRELRELAARLKAERAPNPKMTEWLADCLDPEHQDFIGFENFGKWLGSYYSEIRDALRKSLKPH